MPSHWGGRPLKAWRYVGVFTPQLMLCAARVRIGRAGQSFWAVWDRRTQSLYEHTMTWPDGGRVELAPGSLRVEDTGVRIDLRLEESAGVESVCACGEAFAWTRKQGGVTVSGSAELSGVAQPVRGYAIVDDTAAYYPRHTRWRWSAGIGSAADGAPVAWNLVSGVNDPPSASERTVWMDGAATEAPTASFADDLSSVDGLRFSVEAVRSRRENLLLLRSSYRQPFGSFEGFLPGGIELSEGLGVMEEHDAWW